jgi:hypothetical protein
MVIYLRYPLNFLKLNIYKHLQLFLIIIKILLNTQPFLLILMILGIFDKGFCGKTFKKLILNYLYLILIE